MLSRSMPTFSEVQRCIGKNSCDKSKDTERYDVGYMIIHWWWCIFLVFELWGVFDYDLLSYDSIVTIPTWM